MAIARGTETILLVDDEEAVLKVAGSMLRKLGYTVHLAESGESALIEIHEHGSEIDLMLTDWMMPELHGNELLEQIRATGYDGPIAVVSGELMEEEPLPTGVIGVIFKPYSLENLSHNLRTFLAAKQD